MRIVIVDDSPITRTMILEMLQDIGHQVVAEVEDLAQALEAHRSHKPDLITLDLSLAREREDGLAVLKAIRQIDKRVKVLVVTGNSSKKVYDQLMAAGATGYLSKPFNSAELQNAIDQAFAL